MNVRQVFARLFVGAIVTTTAACAGGTSSWPLVPGPSATLQMRAPATPNTLLSPPRFQWVTYNINAAEYEYPKSMNAVGKITHLDGPKGECTSGKSTFWIVNSGNGEILEYSSNGKKVLATLEAADGFASQCSVSQRNGDLATLGLYNTVVIYKGGQQSGAMSYYVPGYPYFIGYDTEGNLFVDGFATYTVGSLLELTAGGTSFQSVSLPNALQFPGSVQWDGQFLAVTDQMSGDVYRYTISGYKANLEGTVSLSGALDCATTWIAQPYLFCGDVPKNELNVYRYPGGNLVATLGKAAGLGGIVQVTR